MVLVFVASESDTEHSGHYKGPLRIWAMADNPTMAAPRDSCGDLSRLPPELRLEVYETLETSDKVNLLRTCRLICHEVIPLVDREASYHLSINYPVAERRRSGLPFREHHGEQIQKVEMHWSLPDIRTAWDYNDIESMIACRWDPTISRKFCSVTFECDPKKATFMKQFTFDALRTLAVFDTVMIRVVPHPWSSVGESRTYLRTAIAGSYRGVIHALREQVAPVLGAIEEGYDELGQFMRFRPSVVNSRDRQVILTPSPIYGF